MGESRTELIAWINELLQLNYTKVEQAGTGAVFCQIIDSIYGDVPMNKVKMNSKQEYEHLTNYKVLQTTFKLHNIDKPIPVDRLVRCKMQDNLEFLQWLKKYWDLHYPGGEYDAIGRRRGAGGAVNEAPAPISRAPAARAPIAAAARRAPAPVARTTMSSSAAMRANVPDPMILQLTTQLGDMEIDNEGLKKERDFYFAKLRDIEIIIAARLEAEDPTMTEEEESKLAEMQAILYSTEEGFEVPIDEDGIEVLEDEEEPF